MLRQLNPGRTALLPEDGAGAADAARAVSSSSQINAVKQRVARLLAAHQSRYALVIAAMLPDGVRSPTVSESLGGAVVIAIEIALTAQDVLLDSVVKMAQ